MRGTFDENDKKTTDYPGMAKTAQHDTLVIRLAQMRIKLNEGQKLDPQKLADEIIVKTWLGPSVEPMSGAVMFFGEKWRRWSDWYSSAYQGPNTIFEQGK